MKRSFIRGVGRAAVVVVAAATLAVGCGSRRSGVGDVGGQSGTAGGVGSGGAPLGGAGMVGTSGTGGTGTGGKGGGGSTPTSSGADGTKVVGGLGVPDRKKLCDWDATLRGGYGKTTTCDNGLTTTSNASQAECIDNWPADCQSTVSDYEACVRKLAADPCDLAALFSPECQKLPEACL